MACSYIALLAAGGRQVTMAILFGRAGWQYVAILADSGRHGWQVTDGCGYLSWCVSYYQPSIILGIRIVQMTSRRGMT